MNRKYKLIDAAVVAMYGTFTGFFCSTVVKTFGMDFNMASMAAVSVVTSAQILEAGMQRSTNASKPSL